MHFIIWCTVTVVARGRALPAARLPILQGLYAS